MPVNNILKQCLWLLNHKSNNYKNFTDRNLITNLESYVNQNIIEHKTSNLCETDKKLLIDCGFGVQTLLDPHDFTPFSIVFWRNEQKTEKA